MRISKRNRTERRTGRGLGPALLLLCAFLFLPASRAQDLSPEQFAEQSLQFRTALHYDPLLEKPLESLVRLYREGDRLDELVGLYRSHIEQYPDDAGAKTVLVRILKAVDRPGSGELIASAVPLHPDFAPLQYLMFRFLEEKGDARASESLSRAIDLEQNPARRAEWLEELLQVSEGEEARALAVLQLKRLLDAEGQDGEGFLGLARLMQRYQFWALSLEALDKAKGAGLTAEAEVEADIFVARGLAEGGQEGKAGEVLDELLEKLAPDHWRRREIMSLRIAVVASDEQRERMMNRFRKAYENSPGKEAAVLDYAEVLVAAEHQSEAAEVLVKAAAAIPGSKVIEARALEMLESINDTGALVTFLEERLEQDPERADLRFLLVKVLYSLGKDADAEQDFRVVLAGLEPDEISARILDLQRYLRSIERIDAARPYLEGYVRNHPSHLEVARELAEIYAARDEEAAVDALVTSLDASAAAEETVVDLAEFLVSEGIFAPARHLLAQRLSADPGQFRIGLLLVEVLGELGDTAQASRLISSLREMTDTPERYAQWLESAVTASGALETLDPFFDSEQNRFSFDDGEWPEAKVEKFVILCEVGRQRLLTDRVADAVRQQLAGGTFDARLKVRLRRLLVGVLEADPAATAEVEEQLRLLATEDADNRTEYDLRRALVYHRSQRVDLAQDLLVGIDLETVASVGPVREAVEVLVGYGFLAEAASALAAVNRLAPEDVFSWEKRLTLLAVLGDEAGFRAVVRGLRNGDAGIALREESIRSLEHHLLASYWRSVARLVASGDPVRFEEVLPLLAAVDRENQSYRVAAWTEWTRAMVLQTLGRADEAGMAMERFLKLVSEQDIESVRFPDGLVLSAAGAKRFLGYRPREEEESTAPDASFLNGNLAVKWAFESDPGSRILRIDRAGKRILALDDRGTVYGVDEETGKLLWRVGIGRTESDGAEQRSLFLDLPEPPSDLTDRRRTRGFKLARSFVAGSGEFVLVESGALYAFSAEDGTRLWSAALPFAENAESVSKAVSSAGTRVVADGERVFVHRPDSGEVAAFGLSSGKLLWKRSTARPDPEEERGTLFSLNAGLDASDGLVFLYGWESVVLDAENGEPLWVFSEDHTERFPVVLRKDRGDAGADPAVESEPAEGKEAWKGGYREGTPARRELVDFLRDVDSGADHSLRPEGDTSMLSPAVFWSQARLFQEEPSMGRLEGGFLWLMQRGSVRRVSSRLPVASRELPASGTFLGRVDNHLWFREGASLRHLDFNYRRVSVLEVGEIGAEEIRAAVSGNQLVVRGASGVRIVNALTGRVIGGSAWPESLRRYLEEFAHRDGEDTQSFSLWQGSVRIENPGEPGYCLPVGDIVLESSYVTRFGNRAIVSLAKEAAPESR